MKDYEQGKRVLSPSIFRKSKGPIILAASSAAISTTMTFDTVTSKGNGSSLAGGSKKGD